MWQVERVAGLMCVVMKMTNGNWLWTTTHCTEKHSFMCEESTDEYTCTTQPNSKPTGKYALFISQYMHQLKQGLDPAWIYTPVYVPLLIMLFCYIT